MNRWGFLGAGRKRLRGRSETKIWRSSADLISHTGAADEINLTCAAVIVNKLMLMLLVSPVFACYGEEEKGQTASWVSHECKYCDVTMAIKTADFSMFIQKLLDNSVYRETQNLMGKYVQEVGFTNVIAYSWIWPLWMKTRLLPLNKLSCTHIHHLFER